MSLTKYDIDQLCLFDDEFFAECFRGHPECTEELLRIILGISNIRIVRHRVQNPITNNDKRGVRLDVYAVGEDNSTVYNIEIQKTDTHNLRKRSRYNSSMIDARTTIGKNDDFNKLPESYVIFICRDDIIKGNEAVYHFKRRTDKSVELEDGTNIIFVNGSYEGDDDIGKLMSDFVETDVGKMNNSILAGRVAEAREEEEARRGKKGDKDKMIVTHFDKLMMKEREAGLEEGREAGLEEGKAEGSIDTARRMLAKGKLSLEEIAEYSDLPVEKIKELAKGA